MLGINYNAKKFGDSKLKGMTLLLDMFFFLSQFQIADTKESIPFRKENERMNEQATNVLNQVLTPVSRLFRSRMKYTKKKTKIAHHRNFLPCALKI